MTNETVLRVVRERKLCMLGAWRIQELVLRDDPSSLFPPLSLPLPSFSVLSAAKRPFKSSLEVRGDWESCSRSPFGLGHRQTF